MKHALWLCLLKRLVADPAPLSVVDTHAGAGLYDLQDHMARRSGEAEAGIVRLMAAKGPPAVFSDLRAAVRAENPQDEIRYYPGSPLLTAGVLRAADAFTACELRADDRAVLLARLRARRTSASTRVLLTDGYAQLGRRPPPGAKPLYLIDPPFERGDEYALVVLGVAQALHLRPDAVFAIWAPLKDLETFDALLRRLEALGPPSLLVAQARLRPLVNPMKMNGSVMVLVGAPDLTEEARAVCTWIVSACGEAGGATRVQKLIG